MSLGEDLPAAAPEAQGIPSSAILDFVDAADERIDALHSLMLLRHGHVVAQGWWSPYRADRPHMLFSVSKSFTSTAVGLAVAEGRLSVDDPVLPFFPDAAAGAAGDWVALRVRHLLTMTTGHGTDTVDRLFEQPDGDWARAFFAQPVEHEPGTRFVYNSGASYVLSAIVQRLTGDTVLEYLRPRLLAPLGIAEASWDTCPRGVSAGGWGLSLRTADVARFGQLYLREGIWRGKRLVPEAWVRAATARQVGNDNQADVDWRQGYGYQFWRCRHDVYRADGAFGQFCLVMPEQDAVLVLTAGTPDTQALLDLVWDNLLPAMRSAPLPRDDASRERLDRRLATLRLPPVAGGASSPVGTRVSGRTYVVTKAPQEAGVRAFVFDVEPDGCRLTTHDDRGAHEIACGHGEWRLGTTTLLPGEPTPIAASAAWADNDTYVIRVCAYEKPFARTLTCRFEQDGLTVAIRDNVSFGPTEYPLITAERAA